MVIRGSERRPAGEPGHRLLLVTTLLAANGGGHLVMEELERRLCADGVRTIAVSDRRTGWVRGADMVLTVWRRRKDFDLAIVDLFSGRAFLWGDAVCALLRRFRKPHIVVLHGGGLPGFARGREYRMRRLLEGAAVVAAPSRYRWRALAGAVVVLAILMAVILPRLEAVTGGVIRTRFTNTDPTGRELLVSADLRTWSENLILGAGPGMGAANRSKVFHATTVHTEYTRLLAEHRLLGLMALALLILMAMRNLRTSASRRGKALAAAMLAYFLLHLAVDATRLAAPCFAFGLSAAAIVVQRRRVTVRRVPLPAGFPQPVPGA